MLFTLNFALVVNIAATAVVAAVAASGAAFNIYDIRKLLNITNKAIFLS